MSSWTPSIVPTDDQSVYLVMDDFGKHGRAWRETDAEQIDLETIVTDLLEGQYSNPVRVVGFNAAEGWARDVSEDVAAEIRHRCDLQATEVPAHLASFHGCPREPRPAAATACLMACLRCEGEGWVCENHPDQPWQGPHACQCGGMPCLYCNHRP
jgi:hypothetical protein